MGEESTTRPPRAAKACSTCSSGRRSAAESPTSKVCHVPTPITGRASPEDGMGRVLKGARPSERTSARSAPSAAAPARTIASRRDSGRTDRDGMERG